MTTLETTQTLPLQLTEDGTIRIGDSRVSLESIVHHYDLGASAEQIAQKFPSLDLADIYATFSYIINNKEEVKEYLKQQEEECNEIQRRFEAQYQNTNAEIRARILTRREAEREKNNT